MKIAHTIQHVLILYAICCLPCVAQEKGQTEAIKINHQHSQLNMEPALQSAWQAYLDGDLKRAWQAYSELLQKSDKNHQAPERDVLLGLAAIAQLRTQDGIAIGYYRQLLSLDPRDPYAHAALSTLTGRDPIGEVSRLKQLLSHYPHNAALHFALGNSYARLSRWAEAKQAFFNAHQSNPNNTAYCFNLAVSLDHLQQNQQAADFYRQALQLDPDGIRAQPIQQRLATLASAP